MRLPLQNRVDPFGAIHAVGARGLFTGNRGIIHDPATRTLLRKRWATKAWIICSCRYKDIRRGAMGYNRPRRHPDDPPKPGWTELFFLDEVTALAAGHRPCFTCRRAAAKAYAGAFADAFKFPAPKVAHMDVRLHAERLASGGKPRTLTDADLHALPDGAMIAADGIPFAVRDRHLLPWSFGGYGAPMHLKDLAPRAVTLLTPATSLAVLRAGFRPVWHASAAQA